MKTINALISILLLNLPGCSDKIDVDIKDSGMGVSEGSINWLDDNRVMFVGYKDKNGKVYIWDTESGNIELYAPEALGVFVIPMAILHMV